jgi:hypothetical protein
MSCVVSPLEDNPRADLADTGRHNTVSYAEVHIDVAPARAEYAV